MNLRHFTLDEFKCSHTGKVDMNPAFLERLDELRDRCNFPFVITSAYRDPSHPKEAEKDRPGWHSKGVAADIAVNHGVQRAAIITHAIAMGFRGIGVSNSFIHVDDRPGPLVIWGYD